MTNALQFSNGFQIKRGDVTETGTFRGYASVFGITDQGGDRVIRGAFKDTLRAWKSIGKLPPMLLQHGGLIGPAEDGIPIGIFRTMEEDAKGLLVEGQLFALETDKGAYLHAGLKSGALDGLSIGYVAREVAYGQTPKDPRRTLKKLEVREISIVTFPMNREARIESAKALESPRDLERALQGCGFSQKQAKQIVSGGWKALKGGSSPDTSAAAQLLRERTAALKSTPTATAAPKRSALGWHAGGRGH